MERKWWKYKKLEDNVWAESGEKRIQILVELKSRDQESIDLAILESQSMYGDYVEENQNSQAQLIHEDFLAPNHYIDPF